MILCDGKRGFLTARWVVYALAFCGSTGGAQDCPPGTADGVWIKGRAFAVTPDGDRDLCEFENYYLTSGVVATFRSDGTREAYFFDYSRTVWDGDRGSTGAYAASGGSKGYHTFMGGGAFNPGPSFDGGVALPFLPIAWGLGERSFIEPPLRIARGGGDCEVVVRLGSGTQNAECRESHLFRGGRWIQCESMVFTTAMESGAPLVRSRMTGEGSLPAVPWLPQRVRVDQWRYWNSTTGEGTGQPQSWRAEIEDARLIDSSQNWRPLFEGLSSGLVELKPGQFFDVGTQTAMKVPSGGIMFQPGPVSIMEQGGGILESGFSVGRSKLRWALIVPLLLLAVVMVNWARGLRGGGPRMGRSLKQRP